MGAVSHSGNIFANLIVRCSNLLKLDPSIPIKFFKIHFATIVKLFGFL